MLITCHTPVLLQAITFLVIVEAVIVLLCLWRTLHRLLMELTGRMASSTYAEETGAIRYCDRHEGPCCGCCEKRCAEGYTYVKC